MDTSTDQRQFVRGSARDEKQPVYASNWTGILTSAVITGQGIFVRIEIAPNFSLQNAAKFDDSGDLIKQTNAIYSIAERLREGDPVSFSGLIDPRRSTKLETGSSSVDQSVRLISLDEVLILPQRLITEKILLILLWSLLVLPVWLALAGSTALVRHRVRLPTAAENLPIWNSPLRLGEASTNVARLTSLAEAALTSGAIEEAKSLASDLERIQPSDENQWLLMINLFTKMQRKHSEEIVTRRFLNQHPENVNARIHLAQVWSVNASSLKQRRLPEDLTLKSLLVELMSTGQLTELQAKRLFQVLYTVGEAADAFTLCARYLALHPTSYELQFCLARLYLKVGDQTRALASIRAMTSCMPNQAMWEITAGELALKVHDLTLLELCVRRAMKAPESELLPQLPRLGRLLLTADDAAGARELLTHCNYTKSRSIPLLTEILDVAKMSGAYSTYRDIESLIKSISTKKAA